MPVIPLDVDDEVLYTIRKVYLSRDTSVTIQSRLDFWGSIFFNGSPIANIGSIPMATQAQAEAGTDNTTVMSPLRTSQAIAVQGSYTRAQADTKFVDTAGDVMSGDLTSPNHIISAVPTLPAHATRKDYVDTGDTAARAYADSIVAGINVGALNVYTKPQADAKFIDTAGDTFTGNIFLAADPSAPLHAATKQYVDAKDALITPTALNVYTKTQSDANYVDTAGDSMTGPLTVPSLTANGLATMRDITIPVGQGIVTVDKIVARNAPASGTDVTNKTYVDTGDLTNKNYIDTQVASRSNYTYVADYPPPPANYLTPYLGTVSTPDPGPLPAQCVFVYKLRGPSGAAADLAIAAQLFEVANQNSWLLARDGPSGTIQLWLSANGVSGGWVGSRLYPKVNDQIGALAIELDFDGAQGRMQAYDYASPSWVTVGPALTYPKVMPFDSSSVIRIGQYVGGSIWSAGDRLYSVELRTGLNPNAGSIIWRFDANEYVSGSSFTDVRGRTWTLTNPAAITKVRPSNPGDVYVDTTTDNIYNYNGTNWINQGKLGAYTSVDVTSPPSSYLTPSVGTVSTPDPGPLPIQCTFLFRVRGPISGTDQAIVSQWVSVPDLSFVLRRQASGIFNMYLSQGSDFPLLTLTGPPATQEQEYLAITLLGDNGAGQRRISLWRFIEGTWVKHSDGPLAAILPVWDSSEVLRIGAQQTTGYPWDDRIYSVELKTGVNPAAGTTVWKFDANDYPGSGSVYTDPRGRVWTLTDPASITKVPIGSGDVHINTSTDVVYKYSGTDWAYVGKLGDAANTATAGNTTTGTGFPEGVVTAPIGTRYIDTAATCGAIEWIKASGTGNTGWRVVYGDTGIRNIMSLITVPTGVTLLAAYLRRINSIVSWKFLWNTSASPGSAVSCYNVPVGFRYHDGVSDNSWVYFNTFGTYMGAISTGAGGASLFMYAVANGTPRHGFEYTTNDVIAWPPVLP